VLILTRPVTPASGAPDLDAAQRAAVEATAPVVRVLGAPGTGKSTVAVERVVRAVREGTAPDACLLLSPTRVAAARLRDAVTARLGGTTTTPLGRTHQSFGFGVLREAAALAGEGAPRLLSGPEQDVILRELLAGHAAGTSPAPPWPASLEGALPTRGFRAELRDLLMRAVELGLEPDDLAALGVDHGRPEWVAGAAVLREYDQVTALSAAGAFDPAWVLAAAADHRRSERGSCAVTTSSSSIAAVWSASPPLRAARSTSKRISIVRVEWSWVVRAQLRRRRWAAVAAAGGRSALSSAW